jgi:2,3-bisphosphoglycerate-independent phosphoglycerate mutase
VKYVVLIADGAADLPVEELDGLTPFQAADAPHLRALAARGRVGAAVTTPEGFAAGSDVCSMCLLGYDPRTYHTGRAPLEAAALGLDLRPTDWIFRLNFVTVGAEGTPDEGLMLDHSAGAITSAEARALAEGLTAFWRERDPELARDFTLTPGVSYRNILVDASAARAGSGGVVAGGRRYAEVATTPPHEIPRQPWKEYLPDAVEGSGALADDAAGVLQRLMAMAREYLPTHEVNRRRVAAGQRPASMAWIWGQGTRPAMPRFADRFGGVRGAMITAVDLLAGIAALIGFDRLDVPGVTSYHDTDYAAQGRATCDALDDYGLVCCHVESPDEASHQGDVKTKVAAIEAIDRHVLGPILKKLESYGDPETDRSAEGWRILYLPDHYTLVSTRKHDATPVPFLMAGAWVRSAVKREYHEAAALDSDLRIDPGDRLMEYFLHGGLARVPSRPK